MVVEEVGVYASSVGPCLVVEVVSYLEAEGGQKILAAAEDPY